MPKELMSGNEAFAAGAWAAGVRVGAGYPGTPSTEILENLKNYPDIASEWSVNEKVALEVGIGASLGGARTLVTMKHVGLNVAADPLFTAGYVGVNGGLVIVVADDPAMHSSQNEQDSRHYAVAAKLPMLEPSDSGEAFLFMQTAFSISERFDTPVLVRTTTRLSHGQSVVDNPKKRVMPGESGFTRNPRKYVMIPAFAREAHERVEARLLEMAAWSSRESGLNRIEMGSDTSVGYITSGVAYTYLREVAPQASVLKLGMVNPLPLDLIREFAGKVDRLVIVEELDPVIEQAVRGLGIPCEGKSLFPLTGEFEPGMLGVALGLAPKPQKPASFPVAIPPRPPALCPGCPHRDVFNTLRDMGAVVTGDIGCYTLGVLPPYSAMDTCIDMGASLTVAQGLEVSGGVKGNAPLVAVIGDSTFAHSGITGLVNAAYNGRNSMILVLDNGTTAMTGMQPNPTTGVTIDGRETFSLRYDLLAQAVGIKPENFREINAYKPGEIRSTLVDMLGRDGLSLVVVRGTCVIFKRKQAKQQKGSAS
ncbi:MAG TPA: thiamine pyrophosphate-dependent enzyme [Spirochaetota bacterium]|nr:thiamine pyrophosphate-dependent enzyme [Spirochaetota bacterium]